MAHHLGNSAGGTRSSLAGSEEDEEIEDDESLFVASTRLLVFSEYGIWPRRADVLQIWADPPVTIIEAWYISGFKAGKCGIQPDSFSAFVLTWYCLISH